METRAVRTTVRFICALSCFILCQGALNPRGTHVCENIPGHFQCCSGWRHLADECPVAICEGNFTCVENEVCVRPNECRCRHGYFGATCDMKCPPQFWGPDCKGSCPCHPHGRCDDVTGACTCLPDRWGDRCQRACDCRKGTCDQATGACACQPGYWGAQCAQACACSDNSLCDVATGRCRCNGGWYGRTCDARCACSGQPCEQPTGRCQCGEKRWGGRCERACQCVHGRCSPTDGSCTCSPGYRGRLCREPCPAGSYGQNCRSKCGHCKGQQPCKVTEGLCVTCDRGWNGTRCDQKCANGFYGENCQEVCPACKDGHFCNRVDGTCPRCNPGWMGDRCEIMCTNATYGDNCASECQDCFNGTCHFVTGDCICEPGFHGTFCNVSCSAGQYSVNCNRTCSCYENHCDPVSGTCILQRNQRTGLVAAGSLFSLLLVLVLALFCWGFLRRHVPIHSGRKTNAKRRLFGGFTRIGGKLPRVPLRRQKLPNVHVSHHDPENTLDCSFIETPSPSTGAQPTPSCSLRGSRCSVGPTEHSPVCSSPHETHGRESEANAERSNRTETTLLLSEDDELGAQTDPVPEVSPRITEPCLDDPHEPTCHAEPTDPPPAGPSRPLPPPASRQEGDGSIGPLKEHTTSQATERAKPLPPDPSTKPRASWIHQSQNPKQKAQADAGPHGLKGSNSSSRSAEVSGTPAQRGTFTRGPAGFLPLEPISQAVLSVWRQIRHTDGQPTSSGKYPDGNLEMNDPRIGRSSVASQPSARNKEKDPSPGGGATP